MCHQTSGRPVCSDFWYLTAVFRYIRLELRVSSKNTLHLHKGRMLLWAERTVPWRVLLTVINTTSRRANMTWDVSVRSKCGVAGLQVLGSVLPPS